MSDNSYYAPTAYDSTRPRALPPRLPREHWHSAQSALRGKDPSLAWGIYFGEFRNGNTKKEIRKLKRGKTSSPPPSADTLYIPTIHSFKAMWYVLRNVAAMLLIVALLTMAAAWHNAGAIYFEKNPVLLLTVIIPFALTFLGALGVLLTKDSGFITFNRRTGIVSVPRFRKKQPVEVRFDELDGYINYHIDPQSGRVNWRLYLGMRDRDEGIAMPSASAPHKASMFQLWEWLQQFMDISKPLPDVAPMELIRHLDPTTAAYDQARNRAPHYWRDSDPKEVAFVADQVAGLVRDFPWEYLPQGNDPYGQYASIDAWRETYPQRAQEIDAMRARWW